MPNHMQKYNDQHLYLWIWDGVMWTIDDVLAKVEAAIKSSTFPFLELETDRIEFKPTPPNNASWGSILESVCAFLNAKGGIVVLGIREIKDNVQGVGEIRKRYEFSGYNPQAENTIAALNTKFTDSDLHPLQDVAQAIYHVELKEFMGGRIALLHIRELRADLKFALLNKVAFKRVVTGDHKIRAEEIEQQKEYRLQAQLAREIQPVDGTSESSISLDALNKYLMLYGGSETLKADYASAISYLKRSHFLASDGRATILGLLVSGERPQDFLNFRSQLHGYVNGSGQIATDRQSYLGTVVHLLESAHSYLLRNTLIGTSAKDGGSPLPEYPDNLLRETVNNAIAHRDYTVDRQVPVEVNPGHSIRITNPGSFSLNYLVRSEQDRRRILRILPESKPVNPKLASALGVMRKFEGRAIGMATLVRLALENKIDIPTYSLRQNSVELTIRSGRLADDLVLNHLSTFGKFIADKRNGRALSTEEIAILSYLIKADWQNREDQFVVSLSSDNNFISALASLRECGLVLEFSVDHDPRPITIVHSVLSRRDWSAELKEFFGSSWSRLSAEYQNALGAVFPADAYSSRGAASIKAVALDLWFQKNGRLPNDIKIFSSFERRIRQIFNTLVKSGYLNKLEKQRGFKINRKFKDERLDI
jgi:ATP-dependent DNA helicase RecG